MPQLHTDSPADMEAFYRLPQDECERVVALEREFSGVALLPKAQRRPALLALAGGALAAQGLSAKRCYVLYLEWERRGWTVLPRHYHAGETRLHPATLAHWKALLAEHKNHRCGRTAYGVLRRQIAAWCAGDASAAVPGMGDAPPRLCHHGMPLGMSYSNLMLYALDAMESATARLGRHKAREHAAPVMRSRVGARPGSLYMFDDMHHNHLVAFQNYIAKPVELMAIDVPSSSKVLWKLYQSFGAATKKERAKELGKEENGKAHDISKEDALLFVVRTLVVCGYHREGCRLLMEGGTMSLAREMCALITEATGGKVVVQIGGTDTLPAYEGAWRGNAKGNPRFKALLEGLNNLYQNRLGAAPGYVGRNSRLDKPEELAAAESALRRILQVLRATACEDMAARMPLGALTWQDFEAVVRDTYAEIEARTDHELEGWEANGWTTFEIPGLPADVLAKMPPEVRMAAEGAAVASGNYRKRHLSPAEVWARGRGEMCFLSRGAQARILAPYFAQDARLNDRGCIEISGWTYLGEYRNADGAVVTLDRKGTHRVVHNPLLPEALLLIGPFNQYIAALPGKVAASYHDLEGQERQMGEQGRILANARNRIGFYSKEKATQKTWETLAQKSLLGEIREAQRDGRTGAPKAKPVAPFRATVAVSEADDEALLLAPIVSEAAEPVILSDADDEDDPENQF